MGCEFYKVWIFFFFFKKRNEKIIVSVVNILLGWWCVLLIGVNYGLEYSEFILYVLYFFFYIICL